MPTCGTCGITFDPNESDANARFSFCKAEHEREYRPGILREVGGCSSGVCFTPGLFGDADMGIPTKRYEGDDE